MEVPNVLFICKRCKNLCLTSEVSWKNKGMLIQKHPLQGKQPNHNSTEPYSNDQIKTQELFKNSGQTTSKVKIKIMLNRKFKWSCQTQYKEFQVIFDSNSEYFPVCNICSKYRLQSAQRAFTMFSEANKKYTQKTFVFSLIPKIDKMKSQIEKVKSQAKTYEIAAKNLPTHPSVEVGEIPEHKIPPRRRIERSRTPLLKKRYNAEGIGVKSLMSVQMFNILSKGHYATINGQRVGYMTPDAVPFEEIDNGLFFICQLLVILGKQTRANVKAIILDSQIHVILPGSKEKILTSTLLKNRKGIEQFNSIIEYLFELFKQLFSFIKGDPPIPYIINTDNKTIAQTPYDYSSKNPESWTRAMKYLLMDLKTAQFQAILKSMSELVK